MGRKSKPPVTISPVVGGTAVPPVDGLPPFQRFLDIDGKQYGEKLRIRLFFVTPNEEEIRATEQEYNSSTGSKMYVIAARMPWIWNATDISTPLFDFCESVDFADDFSEDIVRLVINRLKGRQGQSKANWICSPTWKSGLTSCPLSTTSILSSVGEPSASHRRELAKRNGNGRCVRNYGLPATQPV